MAEGGGDSAQHLPCAAFRSQAVRQLCIENPMPPPCPLLLLLPRHIQLMPPPPPTSTVLVIGGILTLITVKAICLAVAIYMVTVA